MTEYLLILAAISIAAAGVFGAFGDTIRHQVAGLASELAGRDGSDAIAGAAAAARRADGAARRRFFGGGTGTGTGTGGGGGLDPTLPFQPPGTGGGGGGGGLLDDWRPPPVMCPSRIDRNASGATAGCDSDMSLSPAGAAWLQAIETLVLQPYDDQVGITDQPLTEWSRGATIGYGHLITEDQWDTYKNGITREWAEELFWKDAQDFIDAVNETITVAVTQHQFDAMVILAFNIGEDAFRRSSVAKLVNDPAAHVPPYASLEEAWKAWNKSQGKVNRGLINRRAAEWDMYSNGIYRHW